MERTADGMTEPVEQEQARAVQVWMVWEHKTLESCIQYFGKDRWTGWTDPVAAVGDILVSRMGRFVITAVEPGVEDRQWHAVAKPEIPA
jgi:hypothetical protein